MPEYSIRISTTKEHALQHIETIKKAFNYSKFIFSFEISPDGLQHIHGYFISEITFPNTPAGDKSRQRFMNKLGYKGNNSYSLTPTKTTTRYLIYLLKDLDILEHNFSEEEIKVYLNDTNLINESKKGTIFQKLRIYIKRNNPNLSTLYSCQLTIIKFYQSFQKMPNTKNLLLYMANTIYAEYNKKTPEELLETCYNIHPDQETRAKTRIQAAKDTLEHLDNHRKKLTNDISILELEM